MRTIISELTIKNFKSIKEIKLEQCKPVNLFVGKPNTGKSNILEAISLLSGGFNPGKKIFEGSIFYETLNNLFFNQDISQIVSVQSDVCSVQLSYFQGDKKFGCFAEATKPYDTEKFFATGKLIENLAPSELDNIQKYTSSNEAILHFRDMNLSSYLGMNVRRNGDIEQVTNDTWFSPIRSYVYSRQHNLDSLDAPYLLPPHGNNLWGIISRTPKLSEVVGKFFNQFNLDLIIALDDEENKIKIQKKSDGFFVHLPYSLVADTLQRMIFHLAAIYSNNNAVILFEEPESHTYTPYQNYLAGEIIADEQNQYFITTHSDSIFDSILREAPEKVAVFIVGYDDYQTKVRPLSDDEVRDYLNSHASIFQNLDAYETL